MIMIYPQLVQYGPGLKFEGDWATSWKTSANGKDWTFTPAPGHEVVGRRADDRSGRGLDDQHDRLKYGKGPTALVAAALAHVKSAEAAEPDDARDPLRGARRQRARAARAVLHPAAARLAEARGRERQGPEDVPPGAPPADRHAAAPTRSRSTRRRARRRSSPTRTSTGRSRTPQASRSPTTRTPTP